MTELEFLTGGRSLLGADKLFALLAAAARTNALACDIAEMGIYRGGTARMLSKTSQTVVHLFDTFCGLPFDDSDGIHREGEFAECMDEVRKFLGAGFIYHIGLLP